MFRVDQRWNGVVPARASGGGLAWRQGGVEPRGVVAVVCKYGAGSLLPLGVRGGGAVRLPG